MIYLEYHVPNDLRDQYKRMNGRFAALLNYVVKATMNENPLDDVNEYLAASFRDSPNVNSNIELIKYLRNRCYLSNFAELETFVEYFNLTELTEKVKQLHDEHDEFYKRIKASDFAQQAIKDHEVSPDHTTVSHYFDNKLYIIFM